MSTLQYTGSMSWYDSQEHRGRTDRLGHLWRKDDEPGRWVCTRCGNRLHGVKRIHFLDGPDDGPPNHVHCKTNHEEESALQDHERENEVAWEEWAGDAPFGDPNAVPEYVKRAERREARHAQRVKRLEERIEELETEIRDQRDEWWLSTMSGGLWHSTTLAGFEKILSDGRIEVRDDGPYAGSWQAQNGYVCLWDFREPENVKKGSRTGGRSHLDDQLTAGVVWLRIDPDQIASGDAHRPQPTRSTPTKGRESRELDPGHGSYRKGTGEPGRNQRGRTDHEARRTARGSRSAGLYHETTHAKAVRRDGQPRMP